MSQKKAWRRWTWKSPSGVTKTEFDYILTNRPDIVTDVTDINTFITGSGHRLAMSNIKLDVEKLYDQEATKSRCQRIGSKKIEFQLELRNRFEILQELDDIDTMSETIIYMIQRSASRVAKAISKPHKSRISSPTRARHEKRHQHEKRREMAENGDIKQRIEYADVCKTIKKKTREDIKKNTKEIQETIMTSNSLKKVRRTQNLGQDRLITLLDKQGR